jgi:hypothetical protein
MKTGAAYFLEMSKKRSWQYSVKAQKWSADVCLLVSVFIYSSRHSINPSQYLLQYSSTRHATPSTHHSICYSIHLLVTPLLQPNTVSVQTRIIPHRPNTGIVGSNPPCGTGVCDCPVFVLYVTCRHSVRATQPLTELNFELEKTNQSKK